MTGTTAMQVSTRRAVSPVIGVILMVAISVILAAVVGAFVLEVGDRQETAPNASFDSGERIVTVGSIPTCSANSASACTEPLMGNTSQVYFQHMGGETLSVGNVELSVNGHVDAWGVYPHYDDLAVEAGPIEHSTDAAPQPDFRRAIGQNEAVTIASGDALNVIAWNFAERVSRSGGPSDHPNGKDALQKSASESTATWPVEAGKSYAIAGLLKMNSGFQSPGETAVEIYEDDSFGTSSPYYYSPYESAIGIQIRQDDDISVVWQSQSGGKSQTLYKYTAQHTASDERFTCPDGTTPSPTC